MPFLGQDWRMPGEQWVKTDEGWERLHMWRFRVFDNLNQNVIERFLRLTIYQNILPHQKDVKYQPHVFIIRKTKERKMLISLSDVFYKLDMTRAVKDIRKFNYVCKLIEVIFKEKFSALSGSAQKTVFNTLETVLYQVKKTQTQHTVVQNLINSAYEALRHSKYVLVGSKPLWHKHFEALEKMQNTLNSLELEERKEDGKLKISDLPDDCVRSILQRISDHRDIINAGMTEVRNQNLAEEKYLWRGMCLFHFDNQQMYSILKRGETDFSAVGWKKIYSRLVKRYGMRDDFADMLCLCLNCQALFWKCCGHPCQCPNMASKWMSVPPAMCLQILSI